MFSPQLLCLLYSVQIPNARKVNAISKFPLIRGLPVHRQMDESPVFLPSNRTPILKLHSSVQRHSLAHPQPKLGKSLCPLSNGSQIQEPAVSFRRYTIKMPAACRIGKACRTDAPPGSSERQYAAGRTAGNIPPGCSIACAPFSAVSVFIHPIFFLIQNLICCQGMRQEKWPSDVLDT